MGFVPIFLGVCVFFFLIWLFNSVYVIKEWERGVVLRLGKMRPDPKPAGLQLVFWPIDVLTRMSLRVETLDGIKFFLENPACAGKQNAAETWLLLRASGTEPLLRVYCESCAVESVAQVLEGARQFVLAGRAA